LHKTCIIENIYFKLILDNRARSGWSNWYIFLVWFFICMICKRIIVWCSVKRLIILEEIIRSSVDIWKGRWYARWIFMYAGACEYRFSFYDDRRNWYSRWVHSHFHERVLCENISMPHRICWGYSNLISTLVCAFEASSTNRDFLTARKRFAFY